VIEETFLGLLEKILCKLIDLRQCRLESKKCAEQRYTISGQAHGVFASSVYRLFVAGAHVRFYVEGFVDEL
jgi:hypothetical protein